MENKYNIYNYLQFKYFFFPSRLFKIYTSINILHNSDTYTKYKHTTIYTQTQVYIYTKIYIRINSVNIHTLPCTHPNTDTLYQKQLISFPLVLQSIQF